jgi:hypothetical protein
MWISYWSFSLLLLCISACRAETTSNNGNNLIQNGGFEQNQARNCSAFFWCLDDAVSQISPWFITYGNNNTRGLESLSVAVHRTGKFAYNLGPNVVNQKVATTIGSYYNLSFWVSQVVASPSLNATCPVFDLTGNVSATGVKQK